MKDRNSIDKQLNEIIQRTIYIEKLREVLLSKIPRADQSLKLVIMEIHHFVEDIFDRLLLTYISPQTPDQELVDSIPASSSPIETCKDLLFNFGFDRKTELICDTFMLTESTRQRFKALNKFRNGLAHRYKIGHNYFQWKKKDILSDGSALEEFMVSIGQAIEEILEIDKVLAKYFE